LFYGPMPETDPSCFAALRTLATKLAEQRRRLMVVVTPIHPEWKLQYDPDGTFRGQFYRDLRQSLQGSGVRVWNADTAEIFDASAFTDAIHVRWSSAEILTKEIVERLAIN
jgi:hypothetical protein